MTKLASITAVLLALTATASAETYDAAQPAPQTDRYIGATSSFGISDGAGRLGAGLEGGHRVAGSWFVHAQAETGMSGGLYVSGRYTNLRGGLESRGCAGYATQICAFYGADAGVAHDSYTLSIDGETMDSSHRGPIVVPRAGLEIGRTVRLRGVVESPWYLGVGSPPGIAASLSVAYAF